MKVNQGADFDANLRRLEELERQHEAVGVIDQADEQVPGVARTPAAPFVIGGAVLNDFDEAAFLRAKPEARITERPAEPVEVLSKVTEV